MTQGVAELLKKALALPAEARAAVAGSLLESIDDTVDASAEQEWNKVFLSPLFIAKRRLRSKYSIAHGNRRPGYWKDRL
jgi:hypothetical protein